jgi:uncharacterized protein YndB with AHSA1/START domain
MTMAELDRIDRTIEIQASPERVWRALTNHEELSKWFQVRIEGEIKPGSEVWMTSQHPDHAGKRWPVRIVELTAPRRVVWQWHPGDMDSAIDYSKAPHTTVTFTLEPSGKGTRLILSETGFDAISLERRAKAVADNSQGWNEVLVWLQRHVEAAG